MKNFDAPQEVKDRIVSLFGELHQLCVDNGMPYIAACITQSDDVGCTKSMSAYLDGTKGVAPSSFVGAIEILKLPAIPKEVIEAIKSISEIDLNTQCDCPACQLDRKNASNLH